MHKEKISLDLARRIALRAQLLDGKADLPSGKDGVLYAIGQLGYIQIDTISVIERAHNHTLWTRLPDYQSAYIDELQEKDRRLFEYWGHAHSYLPVSDYRFSLPRMREFSSENSKWEQKIAAYAGEYVDIVLERIKAEGPLSSKDFPKPEAKSMHPWLSNPARAALHLLQYKGTLMVSFRRKFQRYLDITERVLPEGIDTSHPTDEEHASFLVSRALRSFGFASEREMKQYLGGAPAKAIKNELMARLENDELVEVEIDGQVGSVSYAAVPTLENAYEGSSPQRVRLLSPFDNLIIQRERAQRLFDFEYTIECYVPAAKRKFGYFVLPILWGDRLVGRLDPKADRKNKTLLIRSLFFEPWFEVDETFLVAFANGLVEFARFNGCDQIVVEKTEPKKWRRTLQARIKRAL